MKLLFKAFSMIFVIIGVMSYALYLRTGRLPWQGLKAPKMPALEMPERVALPGGNSEKEQIYKWQDEEGTWHYSSEPPVDDANYQQIEIDPNVNVVAATKIEEELLEPVAEKKPEEVSQDIDSPYSPGRVKKLMDDAKNLEKVLKQRDESQKAVLDTL